MKVAIIEDEEIAAEKLTALIRRFDPSVEVVASLDSVKGAVKWLSNNPQPDLLFLDIHLGDGLSFAIFEKVKVTAPIIFTTAFDEYAVKAFKLNSIDYLLKPIRPEELNQALLKYRLWSSQETPAPDLQALYDLIVRKEPSYKTRFSVVAGQKIKTFPVEEVAYFVADEGLVCMVLQSKARYPVDYSLDQLSEQLNPKEFFRINRQYLIRLQAIANIHVHPKSKLQVEVQPPSSKELFVSLDRVTRFKEWLDA